MAKGGAKSAKKGGSNIFNYFSRKQIQEFKEAFGIMDTDRDGIVSASDLEKAFANVGRPISGSDASSMIGESPGPVNFTQMVMLFANKMAGGTDDDETILKSLDAFNVDGKIDADNLRSSLMTFGDKFSATEIDEAFAEFKIEGGMIDAEHLTSLLVSNKSEEEEEG